MAVQLNYKSYTRGSRMQTVDETYAGGMNYTNAPLAENFSKALVNYDITTDGALRTRRGLVSTSKQQCSGFQGYNIVDADVLTTFDTAKQYQHIIMGALPTDTDTAVANTNLKLGKIRSFYTEANASETSSGTSATNAYYKTHPKTTIHDMEYLPETQYIGCRAYNNDYYFMTDTGLKHTGYRLSSYNQATGASTYSFSQDTVDPKVCELQEATNRGYNMLLDEPYKFDNLYSPNYAGITLQGLLPYNEADQLELTPTIGQVIKFKCIGKFKTTNDTNTAIAYKYINYKFEVSYNNGVNFVTLKDYTTEYDPCILITNLDGLSAPYTVSDLKHIIVRLTVNSTAVGSSTVVSTSIINSFDFSKKKDLDAANYDLKEYTLKNAQGMTFWKERLILWGVPEDKTMLFVSETRDPSYFPYPNNVNLFDEPIVNVVPLLDNLIVFTTSKIYIMTIDTDYIHLTQKCIQNNLRVEPSETRLMQVVKNMIFFKSGNYFYMVVPKANSLTGELTIAPVSKNISYFLDNFTTELYKILDMVYNYSRVKCEKLKLTRCYNYLDYEDVTNVYAFQTPDNTYLNFCLLYNTIQRCWRMYVYETPSYIQPVVRNATDRGIYCMYHMAQADFYNLKYDRTTAVDTFGKIFKNYQLYDAGYRSQTVNLKKRYREVQFIMNNVSSQKLRFGTGVFIDGGTRTELYDDRFIIKALSNVKYTTEYTGTEQHVELVIEPSFANIAEIPGATVLGTWELNSSRFPEQTVYKVRFPISGKGYAPRLLLVNKDEQIYEIMNTSYISRTMYSR